ncbi:MAG TPA: hypothetical protein VFR64_12610 [Methylomirabilota bacterium]|nr:hypothetical protein [Methylomirabilota bacterium]
MRWLPGLLGLTLLSGCTAAFDVAGVEWTRSNTTYSQITLDQTECARAAYDAGATSDLLLGGLLDVVRLAAENGAQAQAYRDCLTSRGYERVAEGDSQARPVGRDVGLRVPPNTVARAQPPAAQR